MTVPVDPITPATGRNARFADRREHIIDKAAALFARNGYAGTGVTELGDAVGLGRGALYYYIESKETLLVTIQDRVLAPLLDRAMTIGNLDAPPTVRLRLLSESLLTLIFTRTDHIRVYEHEYTHLTGENLDRVIAQRRSFEAMVQQLIEDAITEGTLRVMDARLATLQFLNMHNHTYQWARSAARHWSVEILSREYCQTLFHGMAAADRSAADEGLVDATRALLGPMSLG